VKEGGELSLSPYHRVSLVRADFAVLAVNVHGYTKTGTMGLNSMGLQSPSTLYFFLNRTLRYMPWFDVRALTIAIGFSYILKLFWTFLSDVQFDVSSSLFLCPPQTPHAHGAAGP
jgi:hypothetical protein